MRNEKFGYQAYCSLNSVLKQVEMEGTGWYNENSLVYWYRLFASKQEILNLDNLTHGWRFVSFKSFLSISAWNKICMAINCNRYYDTCSKMI